MALVRTTKVTGKGRVTVPIAVRKALKLEGGDIVRDERELRGWEQL